MKHIDTSTIEGMEKRQRVKFINSLPGFKSLNLIGTVDGEGATNLSIVSTVTHLGSNPPLLGYISRPPSVDRHTLTNILETGVYTFNQVSASIYQFAHQTSARYPKAVSEFDAVGLTPEQRDGFVAPFVEASSVKMALSLVETVDIPANGTVLVIGRITDVYLDEALLGIDGNIDLEKANTLAGTGLDGYFRPHLLERLPYAKAEGDR